MIHDQAPLSHLDHRAKQAVVLARRRAEEGQSAVIAPEHLLLALLAERKGLAAQAMANLSGSLARLESLIGEILPSGQRPPPEHIPLTAAAEEGLVRAAQQARQWGDDHVGTEHMLLGLLVTADDAAVRRLGEAGVTHDTAHAEITRLRTAG